MRLALGLAIAAALLTSACTPEEASETDDTSVDEPPYFVVGDNASGPLTLDELNINIPSRVARHWSDGKKTCFFAAVERRAAEAGDPETLNPDDVPYWDDLGAAEWERFSPHMRRVLLAQAVISWAALDC